MAEYRNVHDEQQKHETAAGSVESTDRGLFGFMGKKEEEKPHATTTTLDHHPPHQDHQVMSSQFDNKVQVEEKKPGLFHRSKSSSSSSSEEEYDEGGEKRRRKKDKKKKQHEVERPLGAAYQPADEKKGMMDKIKDKIPGQGQTHSTGPAVATHGAVDHHHVASSHPLAADTHATSAGVHQQHPEEKKGIMDKIKEKLPGHHPKEDADHKHKTTY